MAICKACQALDISCNGCILAEHFSRPDQVQDLRKLIREFSYDGLKLRLHQIIFEDKSVSVFVSDVLRIFDGSNTKVPSACLCTDDSAISKIVDCSSCVLGRVFIHPDQSGCLEMLVEHFSSVAIFKRYLEVMEHTHDLGFVKFYVKAMYHEIIQVNKQIEYLQDYYETKQREIVSIGEDITLLKGKCIHYQNECNKLMGHPTSGATHVDELIDELDSEYRSTDPRTVPPGFGRFRVLRPRRTPSGAAVGGPSRPSIQSGQEAAVGGPSRPSIQSGQEEASATLGDVSSASEEVSDSDTDYDPEGSN